ncbi:MAG TPA: lactate racemase domain-containing protein, partial [Anaerolineaceae bacterium]
MQVKLAYGHEGLWVDVPDSVHPTIIEPLFTQGLADERASIRSALAAPTGSPPLADLVTKNDTVAVVFSDITRPMPNDRVLPVLLQALAEA